jgi:hypothetical protein
VFAFSLGTPGLSEQKKRGRKALGKSRREVKANRRKMKNQRKEEDDLSKSFFEENQEKREENGRKNKSGRKVDQKEREIQNVIKRENQVAVSTWEASNSFRPACDHNFSLTRRSNASRFGQESQTGENFIYSVLSKRPDSFGQN